MFIGTQLAYILLPVIVFWVVVSVVMRVRMTKESDAAKRAWMNFKLIAIASATLLVILWFALPSTPSLSTFGYPKGLDDVSDPRRLLKYLQDYNRAVVRTTEVVQWLLFLFIFWIGSALYDFLRTLTKPPAANPAGSPSCPGNAISGVGDPRSPAGQRS
jgi:heme/copper-type cytochrome/quinol oxidase subunit 2